MYLGYYISQETNIHLFILAVYCVAYVFQDITKTFPNSRSTQNVWSCSDVVSVFTVHVILFTPECGEHLDICFATSC